MLSIGGNMVDVPMSGDLVQANSLLTARNANESLLLRLPRELRLIIYEYSVTLDKPVTPRQTIARSNKFTWGNASRAPVHAHHGNAGHVYKSTESQYLTVVSLHRTCRAIHNELNALPIFYRVNEFELASQRDIHVFLAALTPERRDAIRSITLSAVPAWKPFIHTFDENVNHDMMALLVHARDLREIKMLVTPNSSYWMYERDPEKLERELLREIRDFTDAALSRDGSIGRERGTQQWWDLPMLDVEFNLKDPVGGSSRYDQCLQASRDSKDINKAMQELQDALAARKKNPRLPPLGIRNFYSPTDYQRALERAPLDFIGENRMTFERLADPTTISSRTRSYTKALQNVNSLGTVDTYLLSKYNMEGQLQWELSRIIDLQWGKSTIEALVAWKYGHENQPQPHPSREPLYVLSTARCHEFLRQYFYQAMQNTEAHQLVPTKGAGQLRRHYEWMTKHPTPNDCAEEYEDMMVPGRRQMWRVMNSDWQRRIKSLAATIKKREVAEAREAKKRKAEQQLLSSARPKRAASTKAVLNMSAASGGGSETTTSNRPTITATTTRRPRFLRAELRGRGRSC
ncbi:hypothetical protein PG995_002709 [Apiospora arundinis]|uniref:DUF7730 domain-containing protein n=1 Tax=Apiospora arundinis TaxID=335852 RepID=A0ABR2J4W3_9PEZI